MIYFALSSYAHRTKACCQPRPYLKSLIFTPFRRKERWLVTMRLIRTTCQYFSATMSIHVSPNYFQCRSGSHVFRERRKCKICFKCFYFWAPSNISESNWWKTIDSQWVMFWCKWAPIIVNGEIELIFSFISMVVISLNTIQMCLLCRRLTSP